MLYIDYKISKSLESKVDYLLTLWLMDYTDQIYKTKMKQVVQCFLMNCQYRENEEMVVSFSQHHYDHYPIYNGVEVKRKVGYRLSIKFIQWLVDSGKCEIDKTIYKHGVQQPPSRLKFKPDMLRWLDTNIPLSHKPKSVLEMKDEDKKVVTFRASDETRHMVTKLKQLNESLGQRDVVCGDKTYNVKYKRVFNNKDWGQGGRYYAYGTIQQLGAKMREEIIIDGKPTTEMDYSAHHCSLAYSLCGKRSPDDPYDVWDMLENEHDIESTRKIAKQAMLRMINAKSRRSVLVGLKGLVQEHYEKQCAGADCIPEYAYWHPYQGELKEVLNALEKLNDGIQHFFYTGIGLALQKFDSEMTDFIVEVFEGENHPVLLYHDSYVVWEEDAELLEETMVAAYNAVMGDASNCKIKKVF